MWVYWRIGIEAMYGFFPPLKRPVHFTIGRGLGAAKTDIPAYGMEYLLDTPNR